MLPWWTRDKVRPENVAHATPHRREHASISEHEQASTSQGRHARTSNHHRQSRHTSDWEHLPSTSDTMQSERQHTVVDVQRNQSFAGRQRPSKVDRYQSQDPVMGMFVPNKNSVRCACWCKGDPRTITGKRNEMIKILAIILIPVCILIGLTGNSFGGTLNNYLYSTKIRSTLLFSLDLAHMIRYLQRERDGSALYLSSIRPETKGFLLERYQDTDKAIQALPAWPTSLNNSRVEFESSEAFLKTLNRHRYELDSRRDTYHGELSAYSDWIEIFIKWFYKSITEARSTKVWKEFVAYQELLVASEYLGRERAMGVIFYTLGKFPTREEYLYFAESQDTSTSAFAAARQYSTIAKAIYDGTIKDNPELMNTIKMKRAEIRGRNSGKISNPKGSLEHAKFWFENMTYFQDMIKEVQVQLAKTIDGMLATTQETDLANIVIICIIFSVVLILCPIIVYAVYILTAKIQRCCVQIAKKSNALRKERARSDKLLHQMVPKTVADQLKLNVEIVTKEFVQATVMMSDIVGFSKISSRSSPSQIVDMLNTIYACMDELVVPYDVFKAETIGDALIFVSGIPQQNGKRHVCEVANLALDILEHVSPMYIPHLPETKIQVRIGCHTGSVVAGVVGKTMPHYTVFGETVHVAMKLQALGQANKIHVSEPMAKLLISADTFVVQKREKFKEKTDHTLMSAFKGQVKTYWLLRRTYVSIVDQSASSAHTDNETDADGPSRNSSATGNAEAQ